ncbi:hypothetical protein M673_14715 [Aureimonas sp. AU20]|nr:hypothetical protein M673_14715 [Aureimonas sp. AU20]
MVGLCLGTVYTILRQASAACRLILQEAVRETIEPAFLASPFVGEEVWRLHGGTRPKAEMMKQIGRCGL